MPRTTRAVLDTPVTETSSIKKNPAAGSSASVPASASKTKAKDRLAHVVPTQPLPTPPATRKRKRARSRVTDSDTEDDEDLPNLDVSDKEDSKKQSEHVKDDVVILGHKKRRTLKLDAIAEELSRRAEEDAFWTTDSKPARTLDAAATREEQRGRTRTRSRTRSPSSSPPAPHLLKRNRTGLFSPPPSRHHPKTVSRPVTPPPAPAVPRTPSPKRKTRKADNLVKRLFPERDSPNNPFLTDDSPVAGSSSRSPEPPKAPGVYVEKPTITMVYRGVKHEFLNPLYDPDAPNGVAAHPDSPSGLDPADPEFSPTPYCPPKLLFPEARKDNHARLRSRASGSPTPTPDTRKSGDEEEQEEEEEFPSTPKPKRVSKLDFGVPKVRKTRPSKGKGKKEKKSEWDSSDEEDEEPREEVVQLRRSPRLNGRVQAQFAKKTGRVERTDKIETVERTERERGRSTAKKDVKEKAKVAPLLFAGRD